MRRPRSKLQVSMFPFLAVLLCVMGALLLILFVMDRRAKIAAQHKVSEMKSERLARTQADEDARKAEWEKAKQALHLSLIAQQDQLKADEKVLQNNLDDATKKLDFAKLKDAEVKKKLDEESGKIALLQLEIANQQNGEQATAKKEIVSKAELLEAAKELADLELAFKKLRAHKENEKQTYSLVPYRGKRGDMRPPIYVECVAEGVLFHPEMKLLSGPYFTVAGVRSEIERRAGPLEIEKAKDKAGQGETKANSYVLFLVRPNGIENYYKAQSYLKGYQLDFGYELVDQHWALDFGAPPPVQLANAPPKVGVPGPLMFPANPGTPIGPPPGVVTVPPPNIGNGSSGSPALPLQAVGAGPGGVSAENNGGPPLLGSGLGNGGISLPMSPMQAIGSEPGVAGLRLPNPPGNIGNSGGTPSIGSIPTIGIPSYNGVNTGIPRSPSFVPIARIAQPIPIASTGDGSNVGNRVPSIQMPGGFGNGSGNAAPHGSAAVQPSPIATNVPAPASTPIVATTDTPNGASGNPQDRNRPAGNGEGTPNGATPSTNGAGSAPNPNDGVTSPQVGGGSEAGAPTEQPAGPPIRPAPSFGPEPPPAKKTPAPPIGRVLGNKDFVITIDCQGDRVSVTPGGMTFRWTASNTKATDQALVQGVKNLIAKRQASVRPGEPPYRPMIRFQVSAEGLRTYYQAYPLLESLGVPMKRENIAE